MPRAGAILIQNEAIALIKRERANELYYVFPGGQMEAGESIEAAVFRELREELGLTVTVGPLVAEVSFRGKTQYYCLATVNGGLFGTGDGPEMTGDYPLEHGAYMPVWMPIADLLTEPVRPRVLAEFVVHAQLYGWPYQPCLLEG